MRVVDGSPSPASLIESLRDIGYSLETAIADVVDNSISAEASAIRVHAQALESGYAIAIVDDGFGMTEPELLAAMRPGSTNPRSHRDTHDLGRFGLGLKTASFSQCRRLTVVSRKGGTTSGAMWDLDEVAKRDEWVIQVLDDFSTVPWIDSLSEEGTVVVWQQLDRVVGDLKGVDAARHFDARVVDVSEHLELVFHRFLTGKPWLSKSIAILVNGRKLEPHDPFNSKHAATQKDPEEVIPLKGGSVKMQAYTLPHHNRVSTAEWKHYAGREGYLKNQGFYVYRENRLILHGTWFRLAQQSELTKLSRVRIDFPNSLDQTWKIDVRKASVQAPPVVRDHIRNLVEKITGSSKAVYRHKGTASVAGKHQPTWNRIQKDGRISYRIRPEHPAIADFREELDADAQDRFDRLLAFISAAFPVDSLFADMSSNAEDMANFETPDAVLREAAEALHASLAESGIDAAQLRQIVLGAEPFKSNRRRVELLLDEFIGD